MKKVIGRRIYNTQTARLIAEAEYGTPGNFEYLYEGLYKTRRGTYFLHGTGGCWSKYQRQIGNGWISGGSDITPLDRDEAIAWVEDNADDIGESAAEILRDEYGLELEDA